MAHGAPQPPQSLSPRSKSNNAVKVNQEHWFILTTWPHEHEGHCPPLILPQPPWHPLRACAVEVHDAGWACCSMMRMQQLRGMNEIKNTVQGTEGEGRQSASGEGGSAARLRGAKRPCISVGHADFDAPRTFTLCPRSPVTTHYAQPPNRPTN